jgi:hypothetical protein
MLGFGALGEFAIGEIGNDTLALTSDMLQQVVTELVDVERLLPALPPRLHHFTSLETAYRILDKDNIRLSHAEYSNDQTEMAQAKDIILSELQKRAVSPFFGQALIEYEKRAPSLDAYVFCMAMDKLGEGPPQDILSQWRAYGQDGRGASLTLDANHLARLVSNVPGLRINPVIYQRATQIRFVSKILDRGLVASQSSDPHALEATIAALVFATPLMKAPGFEEEREWRLIFMPPQLDPQPQLGFHPRRDFLAPYIDLSYLWNNLLPQMITIGALRATLKNPMPMTLPPLILIREIMIGPSGHQDLNQRAFAKLLPQVNRAAVAIRRSEIPYRSLG